jgi:hypothetical protein
MLYSQFEIVTMVVLVLACCFRLVIGDDNNLRFASKMKRASVVKSLQFSVSSFPTL